MAQHTAHITQTLQAKPSIFELVAADSLQSTFYPALERISHFLVNSNPARYSWLSKYYDEIYLFINAFIQQYYIRSYDGSLAEIFYSLSRIHSKNDKFSSFDRVLAFSWVVIVPYFSSKLAKSIARYEDDCFNEVIDEKELKYKKKCIKTYKVAKGIHDCLQVIQYVSYLSDRSKTHSISNRIMGQHLVYLSTDTKLDWSWSDLFTLNFRKSAILTGIVFRALELSAFFLQFVQWWQNETNNGSLTKLPNPEPPNINPNAVRYQNICPICLQTWKIPTLNRISGYIFCFKCIANHLNVDAHCPVTTYATSIDDLIRIYDL